MAAKHLLPNAKPKSDVFALAPLHCVKLKNYNPRRICWFHACRLHVSSRKWVMFVQMVWCGGARKPFWPYKKLQSIIWYVYWKMRMFAKFYILLVVSNLCVRFDNGFFLIHKIQCLGDSREACDYNDQGCTIGKKNTWHVWHVTNSVPSSVLKENLWTRGLFFSCHTKKLQQPCSTFCPFLLWYSWQPCLLYNWPYTRWRKGKKKIKFYKVSHVGVYWTGGALSKQITEPGFHFKLPFLTKFSNIQITMQTDAVRNVPVCRYIFAHICSAVPVVV